MAVANRYKGDCRTGLFVTLTPTTSQISALRTVNDTSAMTDRTFEMQAGASITFFYKKLTTSLGNPPNKVTIQVLRDNVGTVIRTYQTAGAEPADGTSFTFFATSDGTNTGTPTAGVYRLYLNMILDNSAGGVANYNVDTDGNLTVPAADTGVADSGCLRGNAICTALSSNAASYGYSASANMTLSATVTQGNGSTANNWRIDLTNNADTQLLAGSNQAASSTSPSQNFTIGNNVTISSNSDGMRLLPIGNANFVPTSGAILWTILVANGATVTQDGNNVKRSTFMTVDPRITFTQLLQNNDSVFGTPPSSKNISNGQRLTSDLGFLASRAVDSLGNGINGLVWTEKLWDTANLISSEAAPWKSRSSTGSTQGGQAGWSDAFITWDAQLPGGAWSQKEIITTTNATGLELSNTRALTLLSKNPNFEVIGDGGNNLPTATNTHWAPGNDLIIGAALIDASVKKYAAVDTSPAPFVALGLFNLATGIGYYLRASDLTWQIINGNVIDTFPLTQSPTDSNVWLKTFTAAQTANWPAYNIQFIVVLYNNGTPYARGGRVLEMGTANPHSGHEFNPTQLFM